MSEIDSAGCSSSLIIAKYIAEFDNIQSAQAWAKQAAFQTNGMYKRLTVKPFQKVLPVD